MNKIEIRRVHMQNFKCFKDMEIAIGDNCIISGRNATGKTTIVDAVNWVLFNKMADGSAPDKIRSHDKSGKDIDYIDITVELELIVNGEIMQIKKTQKQKWVKPRGKAEAEFGGNVNEYEINGVPMTEKDYKEKIGNIISEEVFRFASNGNAFLSLDAKKRRTKLFELVSDFSYTDVIEADPELAPLEDILCRYTYEEAIAMTGKALKENKKELDDIPVRIDEISKSKVEGDVKTLWVKANAIRTKISGITDNGLAANIAELKQKKDRLIADARTGYRQKKTALDEVAFAAADAFNAVTREHKRVCDQIVSLGLSKDGAEKRLDETRKVYMIESKKEFEGETICPTCGQDLPEGMIEIAKKQFANNKKGRLAEITITGNSLSERLKEITNEIAKAETALLSLAQKKDDAETLFDRAKKDVANSTEPLADTSEIDKLIEGKEKELALMDMSQKSDLAEQLVEVEREIAAIEGNVSIDKRIAELDARRRNLSQEIANCEQTKYLLERYNAKRVGMLTGKVNNNFNIVKWVLFRQQINGGQQEVCEATVDGSIAGNGLNNGHCILAKMDICNTLQKIYDVSVPVFIDNAEALSGDTANLIKADCQMIWLSVCESELEVTQ